MRPLGLGRCLSTNATSLFNTVDPVRLKFGDEKHLKDREVYNSLTASSSHRRIATRHHYNAITDSVASTHGQPLSFTLYRGKEQCF